VRIASVEVRRYRYPFEPPLKVAWDPEPRTFQDATLVVLRSDDGVEGYASGDTLPDVDELRGRLVGLDVASTEAVREVCETVDFHGGRPWIAEVAVWDLLGRTLDTPCWKLLGGRSERILAYASGAERVSPEERVARCLGLRAAGLRAVKIRLDAVGWRDDLEVVAAVRLEAPELEVMVDANQGWRMAGDRTRRWDLATAAACARELEELGAYWLEEPLRTDDYDGYRALRRLTGLRIAAGEMIREAQQGRDLLLRGEIDVLQCDCVLAGGGIGGARRLAGLADLLGRTWSPHTWSNGFGLLANLHLALAVSTCPFLEVPLDPPALDAVRRDWLLPAPLEVAADGTIAPPPGPGFGVVPDFDALEECRVA
jgi:L-alanine-DL-glutamate epimerase-like enolase superfamily enzyme